MKTVLILNDDQMGRGDAELGRKLLQVYLRKTPAKGKVTAVVMYNAGVKLLAKDSALLPEMHGLDQAGIDLMPCVTCIEHYGIELAFGDASNMDDIVAELTRAEKVITL